MLAALAYTLQLTAAPCDFTLAALQAAGILPGTLEEVMLLAQARLTGSRISLGLLAC